MIFAKYKLDILENIITRFPIIMGLIILLIIVLLIGIYMQLVAIRNQMKANNSILMEIEESKKTESLRAQKE